MRQYSTGLAQPAIGRTTKEPERTPPAAPAREQVVVLHGVMTGLANLVNEHLGRLTIGPQATRFLRHLERMTFGNAGWHRRAGRDDPGLWCPYDHSAWAQTLGLSSSALTHLRMRLIGAEIVWYTPDPERRGHGALGWNFDFASWKLPQWGGARPGAGRPHAAPSVTHRVEAPLARRAERAAARRDAEAEPPGAYAHVVHAGRAAASDAAGPTVIAPAEPAHQDVNEGDTRQVRRAFKMSTSGIQDVNQSQSRRQRPQIKMSTTRPAEPAPRQASVAHARSGSLKKEKKQGRRTDADASGVASTPRVAPAALGSPFFHVTQAGSAERNETPPWAQPPRLPARSARAGPTGDPLPPPLPYETLRSYWLRIYREACAQSGKEARVVVHAAARALLGMGHEPADYVLLGQLRHAAGTWGAVLHWILDCAGREVADPRTYLRAIAARQRTRPPHRSQPRRQPGRSRPSTALTDQWADPADDEPMTGGPGPPGTPGTLAGQIGPDARSSEGATTPECWPTGSPTFTERDQSCHMPVPDNRKEGSDDTAIGNAAAQASSPDEPHGRASGAPDGAVDGTVVTPDVPMAHLWHMAQQRLRADLTPAQYSSWLANTDLYRVPDGSLVLVTGTTFAAELIAQRWGKRIGWILSEITGLVVPLAVRMRRPGSAVPDG